MASLIASLRVRDPVVTGTTVCQNTGSSSQISGTWIDGDRNDICCPADLNGDGEVNGQDLAIVLGAWGLPCDG